ncbi:unnamed protein product [Caenorhabditis sp. 36 PRJEB53466]|nr:unnamed protein product [Caenorhabditis sp. 36 PRJEB53466]
MGVELSLDPPVCPIQANGGTSKHKIVNHCDKIVNTIFGLIQIGYTVDLVITRKPGKPQADRLVIQYASVEQDCRDPKAPFAGGNPVGEISGETIIKLSAAE